MTAFVCIHANVPQRSAKEISKAEYPDRIGMSMTKCGETPGVAEWKL